MGGSGLRDGDGTEELEWNGVNGTGLMRRVGGGGDPVSATVHHAALASTENCFFQSQTSFVKT
jgi:hypothetical protein